MANTFTQGTLRLDYDGDAGAPSRTGDWLLSGLDSSVTSFILAVKAGNGTNATAQSLLYYLFDDLTVTSGDWSTFGLLNNGGRQPALSHMTVYTLSDATAVPTPAAVLPALFGMGTAAIRKKKSVAKANRVI